jgi:hypothetical protein
MGSLLSYTYHEAVGKASEPSRRQKITKKLIAYYDYKDTEWVIILPVGLVMPALDKDVGKKLPCLSCIL